MDHLSPKLIQRVVEDKSDRTLVIEIEIDHIIEICKGKILDPTTGGNHKIDVYNVGIIVEGKVIDVKIITGMTVEIEGDKILEVLVMMGVEQGKKLDTKRKWVIEGMTVQRHIQDLGVDKI